MQHFVTIANRQVNTLCILAVEGSMSGQTGNVRIYLDQRAPGFLAGTPAKLTQDQAHGIESLELIGKEADAFRTQWNAIGEHAPQTGTGKVAGARG